MDIGEQIHQLENDIIKIKTKQNSSNDSAILYRLDIDLRPYQTSSSIRYLEVKVYPVTNYDENKSIIMPIGEANNPPTLVVQSLSIGVNPKDPFTFYFMLFGTHSNYPKFDTYGARMSIYSNIKLELASINTL